MKSKGCLFTYILELLYDLCEVNLEDRIIFLLDQIEVLTNRLAKVEQENKQLRRRLNMDSNNSSKPPSSDSIGQIESKTRRSARSQRYKSKKFTTPTRLHSKAPQIVPFVVILDQYEKKARPYESLENSPN